MLSLPIVKSYFAPKADRAASDQLNFLTLNAPFVVLLNNYKSNFVDLVCLRNIVNHNNGFSYHPNKNVKARAFKGFSTVLHPDFLGGLVVFAFFTSYQDFSNFIKSTESTNNLEKLSYFSLLANGHVTSKRILSSSFFFKPQSAVAVSTFFDFNKKIMIQPFSIFQYSINKILLTLDAYVKSIN